MDIKWGLHGSYIQDVEGVQAGSDMRHPVPIVGFVLFQLSGSLPVPLRTTTGDVYTSIEGGPYLVQEPVEWTSPDATSDVTLLFDSSVKLQTIDGFGGAFTEATAWNYKRLSSKNKDKFISMCFGAEGNKLNMGRIPVNSCDFSTGSYSFDDNDGQEDLNLKYFDDTVHRDVKNGMIPLILKASTVAASSPGQELKLFGSPWSPPSWMKQGNHSMVGSTAPCLKADPKIHEAWAAYLVKWIRAYRKHGVKIWGMTAQNEPGAPNTTPWEACTFSAVEQRDFIRDWLGPGLAAEQVALIAFDDQKDNLREWADTILGDAATAKFVWGFGLHWYSGDMFDSMEYLARKFPSKSQLSTEGCTCIYDSVQYNSSWARGARYVHDMIGDINAGAVGWVDWNLLLDSSGPIGTGGPNHANNTCFAHLHVQDDGALLVHESYWLFGHLSRFVPRGARVLKHTLRPTPSGQPAGLEAAVFELPGPVGEVVAVISNAMLREARTLRLQDVRSPSDPTLVRLPPRSVVTVVLGAGGAAGQRVEAAGA